MHTSMVFEKGGGGRKISSVSCKISASVMRCASSVKRAFRLVVSAPSLCSRLKDPESLPCDSFNFPNVLLYEHLIF